MSGAVMPESRWWRPLPGLGLAVGVAALVALIARNWIVPSAKLAAAYLVTPIAKESWIALAEPVFGLPALYAVFFLLAVESAVILLVLFAFPVDRLTKLAPKIARFEARVRGSALARRGLALGLAGMIALPFHSGGGIIGTLAGRALGLPRLHAYLAVIGGISLRFTLVFAGYLGWVALR